MAMNDNRLNLRSDTKARTRAGVLVSKREPFSNSTGSFRGHPGRPDTLGWLPEEWRKVWDRSRVVYTIMSWETPIAWLCDDGRWIVPDVHYSQMTSVQRGIMRAWLLVGEELAA